MSRRWSRDEHIVVLDAYLNEDVGSNDPRAEKLAELLDRPEGSITSRLANYRALDPDGPEGLNGISELGETVWKEYYGREDELRREARAARERLRTDSSGLTLVPVSEYWRSKFGETVETPMDLTQYDSVPPQLAGYDSLRLWATTETEGAQKQAAIEQLSPGDCVLFYHDGEFFAGGTVDRTFNAPTIGEFVWNQPESRHIYVLDRYSTTVPSIDWLWQTLDYSDPQKVRGFMRVSEDRLTDLRSEPAPLEAILFDGASRDTPTGGAGADPTRTTEDAAPTTRDEQFETETDAEVPLTEESTFAEREVRVRSSEFRREVRAAYDYRCAICGVHRETPDGRPEVEAAHILPKRDGGPDEVSNGLALCRLHHWAFDEGWISLTDDRRVLVREAPDRDGYEEFHQLAGREIHHPEGAGKPAQQFIGHHREAHGFGSQE